MCSLCGATFRPLTFVAVEDERKKKNNLKGNEKNGSIKMVQQHFTFIIFSYFTVTNCCINIPNILEMFMKCF